MSDLFHMKTESYYIYSLLFHGTARECIPSEQQVQRKPLLLCGSNISPLFSR